MILTTCKYFDLVGNRCSRVTDGKCNDLQDCEFKYIAELKAENDKLKEEIKQLEDFIKSDGEIDHINHKYTYKLQQTLQEIKEICKNSHTSASEDYYRTADKIIQKITKAEEE